MSGFVYYYLEKQDPSTGYSGKMCSRVLNDEQEVELLKSGLRELLDRPTCNPAQAITCAEYLAGSMVSGANLAMGYAKLVLSLGITELAELAQGVYCAGRDREDRRLARVVEIERAYRKGGVTGGWLSA